MVGCWTGQEILSWPLLLCYFIYVFPRHGINILVGNFKFIIFVGLPRPYVCGSTFVVVLSVKVHVPVQGAWYVKCVSLWTLLCYVCMYDQIPPSFLLA